jgi:hypothetical protein
MRNLGLMDPAFLGGLGGGLLWTPAQISTALWLDAADSSTITTVDGAVSQWNDKSGNVRHVSQATSSNRPIYVANSLNGRPGIDWGSAPNAKQLDRSPISYSMNRVYGVADWNGSSTFSSYEALAAFGGVGGGNAIQGSIGGNSLFGGTSLFLNGGQSSTGTVLPTISQPFVFAAGQDTTGTRIALFIGGDGNPARGWRGLIYEIVLSSSSLSLDDRQRLEGYLAHKWGLTANLPSDHPFKVSPPYV